jgi:type I restriction enzyme R subunit
VPYLLEERISNIDDEGYTGPDGRQYATANFERDIRLPDRTRFIAEDLWSLLEKHQLRNDKTIVFCVDDTHAAFVAAELRRLSGDPDYAARITRSERNSHQLERNFGEVGRGKPRVACTVDLLSTGFDAPDVRTIVFARPLKSSMLYKQMKGRGTRLCEDIDKRYFTIVDYTGASKLEDSEFDGHPANVQKPKAISKSKRKGSEACEKPLGEGLSVFIAKSEQYVCLADGRKIPFDEYCQVSKEIIRGITPASVTDLLKMWIDKNTRRDLRSELKDKDVHVSAFRYYFELEKADDVDILSKVGFDLVRVPSRFDRVARFWDQDNQWLVARVGERAARDSERLKTCFWQTSLDHYGIYGIDDLEQGATYSAPQFTSQFGSFSTMLARYGGATALKADLEAVKRHLYVPMIA